MSRDSPSDRPLMPHSSSLIPHSSLIPRFAGSRILVIGDLVLDEYVVGRATRVSREAPIPVLELVERFCRPGAASNPAANVASLGGIPRLIGVRGGDAAGKTLAAELEAKLVARIEQAVPEVDAVLVSDYKAGVINPRTIAASVAGARQAGKPIAVDTQGDLFQ